MIRHLSFARAMSLLAVFIALGATAYAAGLAKNSVRSKQIKDGAIQGRDIGDGAVSGADVFDGSLTGADVADNSLTGDDIAEGTLQGVSAADSATVNGFVVKKVNFQSAADNGVVRSILDFPGVFRIDAQCATVGDRQDITAFTAVDNSTIAIEGTAAISANDLDGARDISSNTDFDFDSNEGFAIDNSLPRAPGDNQATIVFSTPTGFTATVELLTNFDFGSNRCAITGAAVAR